MHAGEQGTKNAEVRTRATLKEAPAGSLAGDWLEAMVKEGRGLENTNTFEMTTRPQLENVVKCKWVFRVKRTEDGDHIFKARLAAKGFSQR